MITITNQGQRITSTNYWDSDNARAGYLYLSWNAGAARLMVPDTQKAVIRASMRPQRFAAEDQSATRGQNRYG